MHSTDIYLMPLLINIFFSTVIITLYGYLIYKAIKAYNGKSLALQKNIEEINSKQEKLLLKTELEIQEQTFQFISKEIHDNVTQGLSLAKLNLNIIELDNTEESKILVFKSTELIAKALSDLNHLSKSLDADIIESYGLVHAIKYEIERWQRLTKNDIELSVIGDLKFLNSNSELLIFRIIQESINNIIKYAKAENIDIAMLYSEENLKITIKDDGVGFNPDTILTTKKIGQMAGLKNMRQRAESLEGKLIIKSTPGKGTILEVLIPINNKLTENDQSSIGGRSQAIA